MGLHNPVGIIWEAIPFSWLIDYFLSYRARLFERMYDYSPYNGAVKILRESHSFNMRMAGDVKVIHTNGISGETVYQHMGTFDYTLYNRMPGLPFHEESGLFRLPGDWYHESIIAAVFFGTRRR